MNIVPIGRPQGLQPRRSAQGGSASGFHVPTDSPEEAAPTNGAGAVLGMSSLLSLQELSPPGERDRKARKRGEGMLKALARLQRALLGEDGAADALADLNALSSQSELADDPALRGIVADIQLRAAVELARAEMAAQSSSSLR